MNSYDTFTRTHNRLYLTETDVQKTLKIAQNNIKIIKSSTCTWNQANKNKHKMTIDLVNILDKNCLLRTLEMAFRRINSSKFSGGECMPPDPPSGSPLQCWPYQKNILILRTQKVDQYAFSAYRPNYWGEIVWPNLEICGQIHILLLFK